MQHPTSPPSSDDGAQSSLDLATTPSVVVEDEVTADRAQEICAHLLIHRWLAKRSYRDLLIDDALRSSVERRLAGVGLQLVDSYTSSYFAVRLLPKIEADVRFDWASNARLQRGAVALLVILWTRLVLPRRLASDEARRKRLEQPEGDAATAAAGPAPAPAPPQRLPTPTVARTALFAEFGHRFGKTAFARYLGQLKANGFVLENRQGALREGPMLDNLVDGVTMARKLRDSVLWDLLERDGHDEPVDGDLPGVVDAMVGGAGAGGGSGAGGAASAAGAGKAGAGGRSDAGRALGRDGDGDGDGDADGDDDDDAGGAGDDDFDNWGDA